MNYSKKEVDLLYKMAKNSKVNLKKLINQIPKEAISFILKEAK